MAVFKNFPILEVANRLGLRFIKKGPGAEYIYRCPFCGDSEKHPNKGHLYLNTETDTYCCHRCPAEGNSLTLYAAIKKIDTKQAYRELEGGAKPEKITYSKETAGKDEIAPLEKRDAAYRSFLQLLSLYPEHKKDLLDRGLDESAVHRNGYKSVPGDPRARWKIARALVEKGLSLVGVPGFFTRNGKNGAFWDFYAPPGYFIPVRDVKGLIQALKIRLELYAVRVSSEPKTGFKIIDGAKKEVAWAEGEIPGEKVVVAGMNGSLRTVQDLRQGQTITVAARKEKSNGRTVLYVHGEADDKYRWFSSYGMPNGTSSRAPVHYTGGKGRVWVTEGPLKADVASHLLSVPFVGTPGVGAWKEVQPVLDALKQKNVVVAFDADARTNPHVAKSLQEFIQKLREGGFVPVNAVWPSSAGKGIDDALLKLARYELKEITFMLDGVPVTVRRETKTTVRVG